VILTALVRDQCEMWTCRWAKVWGPRAELLSPHGWQSPRAAVLDRYTTCLLIYIFLTLKKNSTPSLFAKMYISTTKMCLDTSI
jgi:hypothetical protein